MHTIFSSTKTEVSLHLCFLIFRCRMDAVGKVKGHRCGPIMIESNYRGGFCIFVRSKRLERSLTG